MNIIAGPCSLESRQQVLSTAKFLNSVGVNIFRGGIWKYRSDPNAFQGAGDDAKLWLQEIKDKYNMTIVTEVFNSYQMRLLDDVTDIWQIGARNAYNTDLLKYTNLFHKPVLYKRGLNMSLKDFCIHSDYIENKKIMCLRGIFSIFPQDQRFIPDISDIQRLREMTDEEICYDVSHAACERKYVRRIAQCAKIMGADSLMIEVHPNPDKALSDASQQLRFKEFRNLLKKLEETK